MKILKDQILNALNLIQSINTKNLTWQAENQDQKIKLSHTAALAEKELAGELAKKAIHLKHEINLIKTKQTAELVMLKTRCKKDIEDYEHYLESLNQLKSAMQSRYSSLPDAIVHTIHHHSKNLLNSMWEAENPEDKFKYELRLIQFITIMHEDIRLNQATTVTDELPENTLKLVHQAHTSFSTTQN
ncbi:MAG: hypothetical protein ABL933_06500 [Methyloglobulus sp.]|nr:hypothetical protein [Methyloglobulus sp.]